MKAVITGGHGFVGRYLEAELVRHDIAVVVFDRDTGLDITDRAATRDAFAATQADVVFHLAAFAHVGSSWDAPAEVVRVNVEGTLNVLDAARGAGVHRALVIGSSEEYGRVLPTDLPLREDTPLRPTTPYGASKVAAGFLALQAWLGNGFETIRVRPFNHTGAGQAPTFLAPAIAQRIVAAQRDGRGAIAVGNLDPIRELLDVRDVVRAYRLLMERGEPGEVYNIAAGRGYTVEEIARHLVAAANCSLEFVADPALMRPVEVPQLIGDASKLRRATGWEPNHTLVETLSAVLEHARASTASM